MSNGDVARVETSYPQPAYSSHRSPDRFVGRSVYAVTAQPPGALVDVALPDRSKAKRMRRLAVGAVLLAVASMAGIAVARLKPAAPPIDRASVWIDTVKRGRMLRDVRGQGTLVSEDLRWIPATTGGYR